MKKNPLDSLRRLFNTSNLRESDPRLLPRLPQSNDFYIVDFPKSGVTWLCCLIANIALLRSNVSETATFNSVHIYIPDIQADRNIGFAPYSSPPVRFLKSHSMYNSNYNYILYLVRNPINVMQSYYRFCVELGVFKHDYVQFCRDPHLGIPAWKKHIRSWLFDRKITHQSFQLIKYEDLVSQPFAELSHFLDCYGWSCSDEIIREAIIRSDKSSMRRSEQMYRSNDPCYSMQFVGGKNYFSNPSWINEFIIDECKEEMDFLGYL